MDRGIELLSYAENEDNANQFSYVIKLNIFSKGLKARRHSLLYSLSAKHQCSSMFLAPRLLVRPSKKRTWNLLHLHAHLCWPFPVNLTVGTMISSSLSLLSKPASHQDDLCPQGGGGILAWRVCAGPTQLSCLTSGVPTSFGALGFVVSLISGDLLKLHFAK